MEIDSRSASRLLRDITNKSLDLIYKVLTPHLKKQFNEGKDYALDEINYRTNQLKEENCS